MSNLLYNEAPAEDKQHFMPCGVCGEMIDCRQLDEIFAHEEPHRTVEDLLPRSDIQYSGFKRLN